MSAPRLNGAGNFVALQTRKAALGRAVQIVRDCKQCQRVHAGPCLSLRRSPDRTYSEELARARLVFPPDPTPRPITRADCADGPRPCPWAACRHHLLLDVDAATGTIKLNAAGLDDLRESCALDVADRDGSTLEEVGALLGLTRERIRQIEERGLARVKVRARTQLRDHLDDFPDKTVTKPRHPDRPIRRFDPDVKRLILAEIEVARASGRHGAVRAVLRRHGIDASHVRDWRRQAATGRL